jgi:hypothetical protein
MIERNFGDEDGTERFDVRENVVCQAERNERSSRMQELEDRWIGGMATGKINNEADNRGDEV